MNKYIQESLFSNNKKTKTRINSHILRIKNEFELVKKIFGKEYLIQKVIEKIENIDYDYIQEIIFKYQNNTYKESKDLIIINGYLDDKITKNKIQVIKNYEEFDN